MHGVEQDGVKVFESADRTSTQIEHSQRATAIRKNGDEVVSLPAVNWYGKF